MFFSSKYSKNKQPISGLSYCDCKWLRLGYRKLLSSQRGVINEIKKLALSYSATPSKFTRPKIELKKLILLHRVCFSRSYSEPIGSSTSSDANSVALGIFVHACNNLSEGSTTVGNWRESVYEFCQHSNWRFLKKSLIKHGLRENPT